MSRDVCLAASPSPWCANPDWEQWLTRIVCFEEGLIENVHILKHKFR